MSDSLLNNLKEYFDNTPQKELDEYWGEVKYLNDFGPDVIEYAETVSRAEYPEETVDSSYSDDEEYMKCKVKEYNIKEKYPIPLYYERLHPKKIILRKKYNIRNRPNSGHGFK